LRSVLKSAALHLKLAFVCNARSHEDEVIFIASISKWALLGTAFAAWERWNLRQSYWRRYSVMVPLYATLKAERDCEIFLCFGEIRLQAQSLAELGDGPVQVALKSDHAAKIVVRFG
jgi:hypothetical protein